MRANARLVVERGRARVLACEPPISMRACPDAVYLVASAAGPIGGDDMTLDVVIGDDAEVAVRSAAASIALPGRDDACSHTRVRARVGAGATLNWQPEPLVAAAGCHHVTDVHVELAATANVRWRELLVLGRAGERPGRCRVRLRVDRGGMPVVRHDLVVGDPSAPHDAFAALGDARVIGTLVVIDDRTPRPSRPHREADVDVTVLPLEGAGALVTALGSDARTVRDALEKFEVNL